jgi:DNA-binding transcriptional MerR regulator
MASAGHASVADRLEPLREHRAQLAERIRRLQASGHALDDEIAHYEKPLEGQ